MTLVALAADARAFAPFGEIIDAPSGVGERRELSTWLSPVPGLSPSCYANRVAPVTLPHTLARVERHPHAAQLFFPLRATRYLVTVMPAAADGLPDVAGARAFVLPRTLGVVYRPGVWHAGITALDDDASFAVLMWRGAHDDDVFASIAPVAIVDGSGGARG